MVSEKKKKEVKVVRKQLEEYPVIGMLDMHKMPGRQLNQIRNKLRGEAVIRMVKKRLLARILQDDRPGIEKLAEYIQGSPALIMSRSNPFKLARIISESKSPSLAREGDIAPNDIVIPAGPTPLPPGPAIGELQKLKLPVGVEGDKIAVKKDTVVAREGEAITKDVADVLAKLGVEPMEIGLNLIAAWEEGTVYEKAILFVPLEEYIDQVKIAASGAFNLAVNINYITQDTVVFLVSKAAAEARALAQNAGVITPETVGLLLAKAQVEEKSLEKAIEA